MKVYLYLLETLSDWEIGHVTAELHSGRFFAQGVPPVPIVKIGSALDPITTMGGMRLAPEARADSVAFQAGDLLILPGAYTWMEEDNLAIARLAGDLLERGVTVAAICGATFALARTGVLDARRHTSNDPDHLAATCPEYRGQQGYVRQPAVADGPLITASGLAPLEFAHEILKQLRVMKPETLEAWYRLFQTREVQYFDALMASLKEPD